MNITLPYDFVPRPYQLEFFRHLDNGGKRAICVWCRRAGKDLTALNQIAKMAMEKPGLYWHVLPQFSQARRVVWTGFRNDGRNFIESTFPKELIKGRNEAEMKLELVNGSIIQLVGSDSYNNLVGSNPSGVVFSEFALSHPSSWDYIRPMLTMNGGWAAFISTPRGYNHLHRLWQYANTEDGKKAGWWTSLKTIFDLGVFPDPQAIMDEELRSGMDPARVRQEYLCQFDAAQAGSVYGDLMEELDGRGGTQEFPRDADDVYASWDLGISDSTAIWFWRIHGDGVEFIDYLEAHGKPLSYYADEIEKRPWKVKRNWLPHDAKARSLQTGTSVVEQLQGRLGAGKVSIGPKMSLLDGIQAARWLLQKEGTRIHPSCKGGLDALRQYHYELDEETRSFGAKPEHDWSSHCADAFRYAAVVARNTGLLEKAGKVKPAAARPSFPHGIHLGWTLDELVAATPKKSRRI